MCLFFFHSQNPFFLYFDKCGWWHADSFLIEEQKLTTHCYSLIPLPFRVFQTPFTWYVFSPTGSRTRGYSPSASRLSDASFLSHDYQSRLEDADFQARGIWKYPSSRSSVRREHEYPAGFYAPGLESDTTHNGVWKTRTFKPVEYGSIHHQGRLEDGKWIAGGLLSPRVGIRHNT